MSNKALWLVHWLNVRANKIEKNEKWEYHVETNQWVNEIRQRVWWILEAEKDFNFDTIMFWTWATFLDWKSEAKIASEHYKEQNPNSTSEVILDEKSTTTKQELINAIDIAIEKWLTKLVLVSSWWHIQRCISTALDILKEKWKLEEIQVVWYPAKDTLWSEFPVVIEAPHIPEKPWHNLHWYTKAMMDLLYKDPNKFFELIKPIRESLEQEWIKVNWPDRFW